MREDDDMYDLLKACATQVSRKEAMAVDLGVKYLEEEEAVPTDDVSAGPVAVEPTRSLEVAFEDDDMLVLTKKTKVKG